MKPRILVTSYYDAEATNPQLVRLKPIAQVDRVDLGHCATEDELLALLPGACAIVISEDPFTERVFAAAPDLRMIAADGVGVTSVDLDAATQHGVIVNNAPFVHDANGDFTIGLILAVMRRIVHIDGCVRRDEWNDREQLVGEDFCRRTLGLLGFGRAAKAVARRAAGFDVKLIAYSRNPDRDAASSLGVELVGFDELLARCDILSIHVQLTEQTRGMIGRVELAKMRRGAYLINTSRGAVIDEPALIDALKEGHLAGAGIDVFAAEPPSTDHPLFDMDNVVVTAHTASDSIDAFRSVFHGIVDDILLYLGGEQPAHVVNPAVLEHEHCRNLRIP